AMKRRGLSEKQQLLAWRRFAGTEAGSRIYHSNLAEIEKLAGVAPSTKAAETAQAFNDSAAGQRIAATQQHERDVRKLGDELSPYQTAFLQFFAGHPILGHAAGALLASTGSAGLKGGLKLLSGLLGGGGGGAVVGGGGAAVAGGGAAGGAAAGEAAAAAE